MFAKNMVWVLMVVSAGFTHAGAETSTATAVSPQVLANVRARDFLYSVGLSEPGTLGVAHVRYRLEVKDAWHLTLTSGEPLTVLTHGGCLSLLQTGQDYLLTLSQSRVDGESTWIADCDAKREKDAASTIVRLNQQRQLQVRAY